MSRSSTRARKPAKKRPPQPTKQSNWSSLKKHPELVPSPPEKSQTFWRSPWFWIMTILVILLLGFGSWYASSRGASSPTIASSAATTLPSTRPTSSTNTPITATPIEDWRTVQTFAGPSIPNNATKATKKFTVAKNWQMSWSCQGVDGVDDWLYIAIYNANGTLYNAGAQVTCIAAKQVLGSVLEAKGGTFYLTVDANTAWDITIQVPHE